MTSPTTSPIVYLVEDDPEVRRSLGWLLADESWEFRSFELPSELGEQLDLSRPGCLVVDLRLPEMSGLELCDQLRKDGCTLPFIIISGSGQIPDAVKAMQRGAVDFITKPIDANVFVERVRKAIADDRDRHLDAETHQDLEKRFESLTQREREVLDNVLCGRSNKQTAEQFSLSVKTIEAHRSSLTRKLNVKSVAELVRLSLEYESRK